MSKSGFSTLNRWLGRKNKDKSMVNDKLSKSSTNLSISSTNINETSQLEYNRITPLPAATTNAPFEQTFRITVLLPKDQLYVTRLGARVPLSKLLELVCDNKLLDPEKYEFRNPVDPSQVYSCDLTIGAVGLCEIRLCHKSESYDSFNSDEIIKLHRTSLIRESLSSSEFSSRNSKHTTKTTSPYSSTNSLNSMDSSALSYGRTPKLPASIQPKMSAPPRKKRAAPRPPSQIAIPEKSPLIMENGVEKNHTQLKSTPNSPLTTKDFSVSTPNLTSSSPLMHSDINGNNFNGHLEDYNENSSGNGSLNSNGYTDDTVLYAQIQKKNALNLHTQSKQDVSDCIENNGDVKLPEPSPRKKIVPVKKKTSAPPAPTPRNSLYQEDAVSLASTNASTTSTPTTPVTSIHSMDNFVAEEPKPLERMESNNRDNIPTPQPRITTNSTSTTLLNATNIEQDLKAIEDSNEAVKNKANISKVLLNRTPTPEPRSLSCEPPEIETSFESQLKHFQHRKPEDDCISKQADSGIGEPVPSPIPDSLPSEVSTLDVKSSFESSSDDDDMVKVYNFKLGKTLVKPLNETKTLEELTVMNSCQDDTDSEVTNSLTLTQMPTPNSVSETSSWNFTIPISPPPNFADNKFADSMETESKPDTPITPKIMERPVLNFEELKQEPETNQTLKQKNVVKETKDEQMSRTSTTPLDSIVDELTAILQDKALDTLIKKSEDNQRIEAAKPNTLSNFTINAITQTNTGKPKEILNEPSVSSTHEELSKETSEADSISSCTTTDEDKLNTVKSVTPIDSPVTTSDEEKLYRKRSSISSLKQRRSITRSDSFHTTATSPEGLSLNKRTSSQLSLDQAAGNLNRRMSSSELSIGESPSLQSLEIIKTILNSRKNSSATSSSEEETTIEVNARRPSEELKFASLDLKTSKEWDTEKPEIKLEVEKPKELPKVYRYSGPPSINFSTWNERPKVQVAIKNEGDYIFGGGVQTKEDLRNHRMSTPNATTITSSLPPPVAPKPAVIQRMGIPEKDFKVPITVKPIKDVVVENVQQKPEEKITNEIQTHKTAKAFNLKTQNQVTCNSTSTTSNSSLPKPTQRPTVESVLRPQTQFIVNTSTLPKTSNRQRFSMPVVAPGPQLLRSTSMKKEQEQPIKCNTAPVEPPLAPFGQNTLRRTGLKEKILAKEEQNKEKSVTKRMSANPPATTNCFNNLQKPLANGELKFQHNTTVTSAKLHLNLKKTNVTTINLNETSKTATPTHGLETPAFKPKPQTPKTAPVLSSNTHNTFTTTLTPPPPPPLPAAMITTIQLKPGSGQRTPTTPSDPRDQLLDAIRSFNREALKKA